MKRLGADDEALREAEEELKDELAEAFQVWPCNRDTAQVFYALGNQWRTVGNMVDARRTGMDFAAAESYLRMMKIGNKKRMMKGLIEMERAALEVFCGQ